MIDNGGNLQGKYNLQATAKLAAKVQAQITKQAGYSMVQFEGDYAGADFNANVKAINPDPAERSGMFTAGYLQSVGGGVAVGVEFRVNTTVLNLQDEPDLVIRDDEPDVVWTSGPVTDRDIVLQRFEGDFP